MYLAAPKVYPEKRLCEIRYKTREALILNIENNEN